MTDELLRNLDGVLALVEAGAADGLFLAAEHILAESNAHVPHEEATLERSGRTSVDRQALKASVSYSTPYAVLQHEDLTLRHDPGRTAKYLENALNSERDTARRIVAAQIRRKAGT